MKTSSINASAANRSQLYSELLIPLNQGFPKKTLEQVLPYLEQDASDSELWFIHGVALKRLGDLNGAIGSFSKTLELRSEHWKALFELAEIMQTHRHDEQAIGLYESVLHYQPDHVASHARITQLHMRQENFERMAQSAMQVVTLNPDDNESWTILRYAINRSQSVHFPSSFIDLILERAPLINRSDMAFVDIAIFILFERNPQLKELKAKATAEGADSFAPIASLHEFLALLSDPLLITLMDRSVISMMDFEQFICAIRYAILEIMTRITPQDVAASLEKSDFIEKLARYFFRCEYLPDVTTTENEWLLALRSHLEQEASRSDTLTPMHELSLLVSALYSRLIDINMMPHWSEAIARSVNVTPALRTILRLTYEELNEERAIAQTIVSLGNVKDDVSKNVQGQYEENPYPRWDLLANNPSFDTKTYLANIFPMAIPYTIDVPDAPDILIAGCGTGMHSLIVSTVLPAAKITNVDLSRASLSYAIRKSREYKMEAHHTFMQADILELGNMGKSFDIVESSGVLHHMKDPMKGWRVLVDLLKPGGIMKIGLYSKIARREIIRAREEIAAGGYEETLEGMRRYRHHAIKDRTNHFVRSSDFYTTSNLRDLLFHRQEHQFTIPQLKESLDALGLKFLCFLYDTITYDKFNEIHPLKPEYGNLDLWQVVEEKEPALFFGMYQFWCYKPK